MTKDDVTKRDDVLPEETGECLVVELDTRRFAPVGYNWLLEVRGNGSCPDRESHRDWYEKIGAKPAHERAIVAKHAALTTYLDEKPHLRNPKHFVQYWEAFLAGPRNYGPPDRPGVAKRSSTASSEAELSNVPIPDWAEAK